MTTQRELDAAVGARNPTCVGSAADRVPGCGDEGDVTLAARVVPPHGRSNLCGVWVGLVGAGVTSENLLGATPKRGLCGERT